MSDKELNADRESAEFPSARLEPRQQFARQVLGASRMWWATVVALAVTGVLVWRSIEQTGPEITIQFPEGHGLQVGDFVRHRGVDVGHVDRIKLADDLENIEVAVTLFHGADGLARKDTRFWIVRPQLSLTEIRGLETAVGAKYIAVSPVGSGGKACYEFTGLAAPPPGDVDERGIEIVLRGEESYGLYPSAPVSWRGVDVGEVLSVDLASDTRYVDVRARINLPYRNLVRSNSMFWTTSGLGIDAGLTGFTLKAESLATIARGGVSFITPAGKEASPIRPGHVFTLHAEEDAEWTEDASTVSLIDFPLPPTVVVQTSWKEKTFGFSRRREKDFNGVLLNVADSGRVTLIAPLESLQAPDDALDDSWTVELYAVDVTEPICTIPQDTHIHEFAIGIGHVTINAPQVRDLVIPFQKRRVAHEPEDCCLVRSVASDEGPNSVIHSLSWTALSPYPDGNTWQIDTAGIDLDDWQGAAVVGTVDGSLIGTFLASSNGPVVVLLDDSGDD